MAPLLSHSPPPILDLPAESFVFDQMTEQDDGGTWSRRAFITFPTFMPVFNHILPPNCKGG